MTPPDLAEDFPTDLDRGYDDEADDNDAWDDLNCGSSRQGQCDLAGTEYCDWSCPLHNEVFRRRRR